MEIMYPIVIIIAVAILIAIFLIKSKNNNNYVEGKKVANTNFVKETEYYKNRVKAYKRLSMLIKILYIICIMATSLLTARIVKVQTKSEEKYNRDIMLSIDLSSSQDEVNLELIKKFRKMIPNIKGDRIGIIIFNTAPIVYCPLTEDYDYIDENLEILEKQLQIVIANNGEMPYDPQDYSAQMLFEGGVIAGNETKGSSLVGDGLARNNICFPRCQNKQRKN